jgi:hypothetical protein
MINNYIKACYRPLAMGFEKPKLDQRYLFFNDGLTDDTSDALLKAIEYGKCGMFVSVFKRPHGPNSSWWKDVKEVGESEKEHTQHAGGVP